MLLDALQELSVVHPGPLVQLSPFVHCDPERPPVQAALEEQPAWLVQALAVQATLSAVQEKAVHLSLVQDELAVQPASEEQFDSDVHWKLVHWGSVVQVVPAVTTKEASPPLAAVSSVGMSCQPPFWAATFSPIPVEERCEMWRWRDRSSAKAAEVPATASKARSHRTGLCRLLTMIGSMPPSMTALLSYNGL